MKRSVYLCLFLQWLTVAAWKIPTMVKWNSPILHLSQQPTTLAIWDTVSMKTAVALVKLMEIGLEIHPLVNVSYWNTCASTSEQPSLLVSVYSVVDCGSLEDPDNGQVDFSNTTFESTANYTCDLGYNLNGNSTRTCEANVIWSGDPPSCERKLLKYLCI